ncbi:hypothetical protein M2128_001343 [Polynucleobacter sphagniphilus]|nr:hypothetical protein [Polynucleobacter sphagniphilus]
MNPKLANLIASYNSFAETAINKLLSICGANKSTYFTGILSLSLSVLMIFSLKGLFLILGFTAAGVVAQIYLDKKLKNLDK